MNNSSDSKQQMKGLRRLMYRYRAMKMVLAKMLLTIRIIAPRIIVVRKFSHDNNDNGDSSVSNACSNNSNNGRRRWVNDGGDEIIIK